MPNKAYAMEWIAFALRNLETAILLYKANHYQDIIAIEAQQSIEKSLKALLALQNKKIPKSHDLGEIASLVDETLCFSEDEKAVFERATDYYKEDRYPNPRYTLPSIEDVKAVLDFARQLHKRVIKIIDEAS